MVRGILRHVSLSVVLNSPTSLQSGGTMKEVTGTIQEKAAGLVGAKHAQAEGTEPANPLLLL